MYQPSTLGKAVCGGRSYHWLHLFSLYGFAGRDRSCFYKEIMWEIVYNNINIKIIKNKVKTQILCPFT